MVIANFPWSLKLLYGLIADNITVGGSRKKGFMLIGAVAEIIALQLLFWCRFTADYALVVALLAMVINWSQAFMDLIVDTILIDQARKNPASGSEDLRSLASFFQCAGMVTGSLLSGAINQYYEPYWCFLLYSTIGLFVSVAAMRLDREIDTKGVDEMRGFCQDLKKSFWETVKIRHVPEIYLSLAFLIVSSIFSPAFNEFSFYYNTNVRHISKATIGVLDTVGSFANLSGVMIYGMFFKDFEFRTLLFMATWVGLIGSGLSICYILKMNQAIGISDELYLALSSLIFGMLGMALAFLPLQVLYVKITPKSIEGTCYAFFVGMENFSNAMISPVVGAWLNKTFVGVTNTNLLDPGNNGFLKLNILAMVLGLT
jgi:hypothetical protein